MSQPLYFGNAARLPGANSGTAAVFFFPPAAEIRRTHQFFDEVPDKLGHRKLLISAYSATTFREANVSFWPPISWRPWEGNSALYSSRRAQRIRPTAEFAEFTEKKIQKPESRQS